MNILGCLKKSPLRYICSDITKKINDELKKMKIIEYYKNMIPYYDRELQFSKYNFGLNIISCNIYLKYEINKILKKIINKKGSDESIVKFYISEYEYKNYENISNPNINLKYLFNTL